MIIAADQDEYLHNLLFMKFAIMVMLGALEIS